MAQQSNIWYTVDEPRDLPCQKVNPKLWEIFIKMRKQRGLKSLNDNSNITEQEVVQTIDLVLNIDDTNKVS